MKTTIKKTKKLVIKTSLVAASLGFCALSSVTYAAPGGDSSGSDSDLIQAIQSLQSTISALASGAANSLSDAVHQLDSNLAGTVQANTTNATLQPEVVANTTTQSLADAKTALVVFPQQVIPPAKATVNSLLAMTYSIPASDTLYSPKDPQVAVFNANPQQMPNNDDYFTIDSLLGPDGYTSDQQTAAQYYVNYLSQSYNALGSTLDLSPLTGLEYPAFLNFQRTSLPYQNYQAGIRSYIALTSAAISNFNLMMAERTVQTGLGTQVGLTVPSSNGPQPVADASPLQVQEFIATRRINNAQWYNDMQAATPATVQRESLFVQAEMEAQLQELHVDNERLLAIMSALELAYSQSQKSQLAIQESAVNSAVKAAVGTSNASQNANNPPANTLPASSSTNTMPSSSYSNTLPASSNTNNGMPGSQ